MTTLASGSAGGGDQCSAILQLGWHNTMSTSINYRDHHDESVYHSFCGSNQQQNQQNWDAHYKLIGASGQTSSASRSSWCQQRQRLASSETALKYNQEVAQIYGPAVEAWKTCLMLSSRSFGFRSTIAPDYASALVELWHQGPSGGQLRQLDSPNFRCSSFQQPPVALGPAVISFYCPIADLSQRAELVFHTVDGALSLVILPPKIQTLGLPTLPPPPAPLRVSSAQPVTWLSDNDWGGQQLAACPTGMAVSGMVVRHEPYQGTKRDDASVNGFAFSCQWVDPRKRALACSVD